MNPPQQPKKRGRPRKHPLPSPAQPPVQLQVSTTGPQAGPQVKSEERDAEPSVSVEGGIETTTSARRGRPARNASAIASRVIREATTRRQSRTKRQPEVAASPALSYPNPTEAAEPSSESLAQDENPQDSPVDSQTGLETSYRRGVLTISGLRNPVSGTNPDTQSHPRPASPGDWENTGDASIVVATTIPEPRKEISAAASKDHVSDETEEDVDMIELPPGYISESTEPDTDAELEKPRPRKRYRTITSPSRFLPMLENAKKRSTAALYKITEHVAGVLKEWQDEWIAIERRLARNEARNDARDPRAPMDPVVYEDQKGAVLYGYRWDPSKAKRGCQDPMAQRPHLVNGRELRYRVQTTKVQEVSDSQENGGSSSQGRKRRAPPEEESQEAEEGKQEEEGQRLKRRRLASEATMAEYTPDTSDVPRRKRGRPRVHKAPAPAPVGPMPPGDSTSVPPPPVAKRRGRPPKNRNAAAAAATVSAPTAVSSSLPLGKEAKAAPPPGAAAGAAVAAAGTTSSSLGPKAGSRARLKRTAAESTEPHSEEDAGPKRPAKSARRSAAMQAWWNRRKAAETTTAAKAVFRRAPDDDEDGDGDGDGDDLSELEDDEVPPSSSSSSSSSSSPLSPSFSLSA